MKRQLSIIIMLLMTVAGWGQQKSGLDLCLRDKETGEWLIGLFDDFAVYDCEYWNYSEVGDKRIVLTMDGKQKEIKLKKNAIVIDGKKHKTETLTSRYLPDYPVKDETTFFDDILDEAQQTTIRILHISKKRGVEFGVNISKPLSLHGETESVQITDSTGRTEITLPLAYTVKALLAKGRHKNGRLGYFTNMILRPGTKTLLLVDDINKRMYAMGCDSRIINELFATRINTKHYPSFDKAAVMSAEEYIASSKKAMSENIGMADSIALSHPTLSAKWKSLQSEDERMRYSHCLFQQQYNWSKEDFKKLMPKLMAETNMLSTALPYHTTSNNLNFIFNDYLTFEKERSGWTFPNVVRWLAEAPENGKRLKMSATDRKMFATYDSIAKVAEKLRNEEAARYMYEDDANKAVVKYCSDFYNANIQKKPDVMRLMIAEDIKREWAIMDACNTTATIRDVQKATIVNKMIETYGISLPKDIVASLPNEIHSKYLRKLLTDANQKLIDYEQHTETEQPALQDNRQLESMTDGREIFEKIIAPYKGKVIYLDVWGTWCTPCKKEMKNVPALKETLKGMDVVFLYLCNGSSDESLKNNIKQFGLTGKNVVHYNLPASQQAALEKYIGLEGYPTYKLIDRNGRIMPGRCPRPSQPDMVKTAIEQLQE